MCVCAHSRLSIPSVCQWPCLQGHCPPPPLHHSFSYQAFKANKPQWSFLGSIQLVLSLACPPPNSPHTWRASTGHTLRLISLSISSQNITARRVWKDLTQPFVFLMRTLRLREGCSCLRSQTDAQQNWNLGLDHFGTYPGSSLHYGTLQTGFVKYPSYSFSVELELVPKKGVGGPYPSLSILVGVGTFLLKKPCIET